MTVIYTCCGYGSWAIVGDGDLGCCGRDDVVVGCCRMVMMDQVPMTPPNALNSS
ncbi:unnamed protein product [Dovyalis caffra]|uniref:Uncharacterized protein n=1 Tax=Dovyalis caffra TaxID=77055 RepID=A0AAV1SX64_9ROSI|nr:unnamed protein product [Dovyalis caffra]